MIERDGMGRWQTRNIYAWDGEGITDSDGKHHYNLLAFNNGQYGRHIINHEGLSTKECFDFFLANNPRDAIHVIFGGSYDVNMILRDLSKEDVATLWNEKILYWNQYKICYTPRKKFSVCTWHHTDAHGIKCDRPFVLWDVFGFFQSSFVNACKKWLGSEMSRTLDEIQNMKLQRSHFNAERIDEIIRYNDKECAVLILLVKALFRAMDEAGITLMRFDGAGAIAAALLRRWNIQQHKGEVGDEIYRYWQIAYSGGRIEAPMIGNHNGTVYSYDINSAYPAAAIHLPSLKGARWQVEKQWNGCEFSLFGIRYRYFDEAPFYPLWNRDLSGNILYPREGRGTYWYPEYKVLTEHYTEGKDYEVAYVVNCYLSSDEKPFAPIADVYEIRRRFKEQGSMASEALKLGLNSVYGKLAQQEGYHAHTGKLPTYHNLGWAGWITSYTRANLYRAATVWSNDVIAFATDAVFSTKPIESLTISDRIGEWSRDVYEGMTIVQPGVYWLKEGDTWRTKYRGFDPGVLVRDEILKCWRQGIDQYPAHLTRFVGMGSALARNNFEGRWRTWETEERSLTLLPDGKRWASKSKKERAYHKKLCKTIPAPNTTSFLESVPYPVKWAPDYKLLRAEIDGVDIRLLEQEWDDSYA